MLSNHQEKCKHCHYLGHSVRKHLAKRKQCQHQYSTEELKHLQIIKKNEKAVRQKIKYQLTKANNKNEVTINYKRGTQVKPEQLPTIQVPLEDPKPPLSSDMNPKTFEEEEILDDVVIEWKKIFDARFNAICNTIEKSNDRRKEDITIQKKPISTYDSSLTKPFKKKTMSEAEARRPTHHFDVPEMD